MEKYKNLEKIAEGTFGIVYKANDNDDNEELVAVKEMKTPYTSFEECKNLREVKSLINLKHQNIIKLKEVILDDKSSKLYMIFEFMDKNLYDLIRNLTVQNKRLSETQIKFIIYQILQGIAYMHKYNFFHRDLKPENVLIRENKLKIADFGLAREIRSLPPYTEYVSTRWYRAPECLLKTTNYNSPIDIWALGTIMAELYSLKPIFPGTSEKDQLYKITNLIGSPVNTWNEAVNLANKIGFKFPNVPGLGLKAVIPELSDEALEVMNEMLKWDPNKRPNATKLLSFPYFSQVNLNVKISNLLESNTHYEKPVSKITVKKEPVKDYSQSALYTIENNGVDEVDKIIEEIKKNALDSNQISSSTQREENKDFSNQFNKPLYYTNIKKSNKFDGFAKANPNELTKNLMGKIDEEFDYNFGFKKQDPFQPKQKQFNAAYNNGKFDSVREDFIHNKKENHHLSSSSPENYQEKINEKSYEIKKEDTFEKRSERSLEKEKDFNFDKEKNMNKNRIKSTLKFIEESFDVNKKEGGVITSSGVILQNSSVMMKHSSNNMISEPFNSRRINQKNREISPPKIQKNNEDINIKGFEFESRRKKKVNEILDKY